MGLPYTDRQPDIMNILWDQVSATVREATEVIEGDLAHTSVLTLFQTLEEDGHTPSDRRQGVPYFPTVERDEAGRQAVSYIKHRLFQGSAAAVKEALGEKSDEGLFRLSPSASYAPFVPG